MAERRMFAKTIIDSDAFLEMPMSARLLYYDLGMRADDDGFVNSPKKIMRMVGASEDDLRILSLRKFIIPFDNGIVVIKHWKIHNYIQNDRYHETAYKEQKEMLELDENKAYRLPGPAEKAPCIQDGYNMDTQVRLELGKDRLGYNPPTPQGAVSNGSKGFEKFWAEYPRKVGKEAAKRAFAKVKVPVDTLLAALQQQKASEQWKRGYIPNPATWLNQGRWEDEVETKDKPRRPFVPTVFSEVENG